MSYRILLSVFMLSLLTNCNRDEQDTPSAATISFTGQWTRQFSVAGLLHNVSYTIHQDSIRYKLSGGIGNANYLILKDTFLLKDQRYIGHTPDGQHYLIFVKNHNADSLILYKQKVSTISEGLKLGIPPDHTTANHGWNVFYKQ